MIGLLNFHKPTGVTSRDAVNRVQRLLPRKTKIGHAGTLDPIASGVLVLCIGRATRLIPYVQQMAKSYRGTFQLGCESVTEDVEGEVIPRPDDPIPTREQIEAEFPKFTGEIMQRPPVYSALKIGGRRAYSLARDGQEVELEPRPIMIHDLSVESYEYPELVLNIECGSGTYVRSLGRDIAESVGTAAVMSDLVRTGVGTFRLEEAAIPSTVTKDTVDEFLQPAGMAVGELTGVTVNEEEIARIADGLSISDRFSIPRGTKEVAAFDSAGKLVAILVPGRGTDRSGWGPFRNFADLL